MAYNPKTATPIEHWDFREKLLKEVLDEIPMTVLTRNTVMHHLGELTTLYENALAALNLPDNEDETLPSEQDHADH